VESFSDIEILLFGVKEIAKDTDDVNLKKDIDRRITSLKDSNGAVDIEKEAKFVKDTITTVSTSFMKREQQMMIDSNIINRINSKIDTFRDEHKVKIENLLSALMRDVDEAVDEYASAIIRGLNPKRIKERFNNKDDFELWLTIKNEHYKGKMEKTVDRRTQSALKTYLIDVEDVFETAVSYLSDREEIITIEDPFYGSLADCKTLITRSTRNTIKELTGYNKSLYEASEDLFNGIWEARQKYDNKRLITEIAVNTAGGAAVSALLGAGVKVIGGAGAKAVGGVLAVKALPIVAGLAAAVIGVVVISRVASKLGESLNSGSFEKDVQACINEFVEEISKSKLSMQTHLTESIKLTFENELKSLDRTFLDFRRITYIDEDKIPKLAAKLRELEDLIKHEVVAV
jgi:hypothetical protein